MLSKFLSGFKSEVIDNSFIKGFYGTVNLYLVEEDKKEFLGQDCAIWFSEGKTNLDYILNLKKKDGNQYDFPINEEVKPEFYVDSQKSVVGFQWKLQNSKNILCLEFFIHNDEYDEAGKFKQLLCRLLFQTNKKTSFRNSKDQDEIYCYISQKNIEKIEIPINLQKLETKFEENKDNLFFAIGGFFGIDYKDVKKDPFEIKKYCLLSIVKEEQFENKIVIYDENNTMIYKKRISEDLYYTIDNELNSITWMDIKENDMVCFNFKFLKHLVQKLTVVLNICILETKKEIKFEDFIKKENNEWEKHYINNNVEDEFNDYEEVVKNRMNIEYDEENIKDYDMVDENEEDFINTFSQAKLLDRTFVSKGDKLGVYKTNDENGELDYICNLPLIKNFEGKSIKPKKIQIQEQDTKAILMNSVDDNKLYYMDFETGKIVNEFKSGNDKYNVRDISLMGKNNEFESNPVFMSIDERNIMKIDPRVKDSTVNNKNYKTNVNFNCISAGENNWFSAGSKDGNIRLYKEIGGNAKNVLPSLTGDPILFIDTSTNGDLILATCEKYILLIPTFQQSKSGFMNTFRKDNKPKPKILRITPQTMAKFGIDELKFTSAKFDHKKTKKETLIIAASKNFLIIWDLSNVMRGNLTTTKIRKLGDNIVNHDVRYNENKLLAATNNKLSIYNTKVKHY